MVVNNGFGSIIRLFMFEVEFRVVGVQGIDENLMTCASFLISDTTKYD